MPFLVVKIKRLKTFAHKIPSYTHTDFVLYVYGTAIFFFSLIFPLFFGVYTLYMKEVKRIFFAVYFFGFIKIISGYVSFEKDGVAIHFGEKKALFVFYAELTEKLKKKISIPKETAVLDTSVNVFVGGIERFEIKTVALTVVSVFSKIFLPILNCNQPFKRNVKSEYCLNQKDTAVISFKTTILFNKLTIILFIAGKITGKIYEKYRKCKQNRKSHIVEYKGN